MEHKRIKLKLISKGNHDGFLKLVFDAHKLKDYSLESWIKFEVPSFFGGLFLFPFSLENNHLTFLIKGDDQKEEEMLDWEVNEEYFVQYRNDEKIKYKNKNIALIVDDSTYYASGGLFQKLKAHNHVSIYLVGKDSHHTKLFPEIKNLKIDSLRKEIPQNSIVVINCSEKNNYLSEKALNGYEGLVKRFISVVCGTGICNGCVVLDQERNKIKTCLEYFLPLNTTTYEGKYE